MIEGCTIGVEIGGGVKCSNFTVNNAVFSTAATQAGPCIRLSGEGGTLKIRRMTFDNIVYNGFARGLNVSKDVLIRDAVRIVNSDFSGAKNELEMPSGKVEIDGKEVSSL
jgi:hypothetical protein